MEIVIRENHCQPRLRLGRQCFLGVTISNVTLSVRQYLYKTSFKRMYNNPIDYEVGENEQSLEGTNDDDIQRANSNKERISVDLLARVG